MKIREEVPSDFNEISTLIESAFRDEEHSDGDEHLLVERIRKSDAYVAELSLVAVNDENRIVGHIMLSRITIDGKYSSLALAPVSVLPEFQGRGVGGELIREAHKVAAKLGYGSVILLGHKDYYPRFGYTGLSTFGINLPFDVPQEYCMAIELYSGALDGVSGTVVYPEAFNG